jgi:hypothetical protein
MAKAAASSRNGDRGPALTMLLSGDRSSVTYLNTTCHTCSRCQANVELK